MATREKLPMSSHTINEVLGRALNDVEEKFAPKQYQTLYVNGIIQLPLPRPRVSIVGSRKASPKGLLDASRIAKELVGKGVVIVSGLAEGIDTSAHESTMKAGGKTIAVLGTPLNKTYPGRNFWLQEEIMRSHLAVSQFQIGHQTRPRDFVIRNRTMALISDATIIVEAEDMSGSRHQGWEALRLGRPLFIWRPMFDKPQLRGPDAMRKYGAIELNDPTEVLEYLPSSIEMLNIFS